MIRIVSKYLVPKGYKGLTVFPFVFLKQHEHGLDVVLLNHEKIHLRQQRELLVLPFFVWYGLEFLWHFLRQRDVKRAYYSISFEREAYANEKDLHYLKQRPFWKFLKYFG